MDEVDVRLDAAKFRQGYLAAINDITKLVVTAVQEDVTIREFGRRFVEFHTALTQRTTAALDQDQAYLVRNRHA